MGLVRLGPGPAQIWRLDVTCQQTTRLVATALARMRGRIHSTLPVIRRSAPINQFYQKFIPSQNSTYKNIQADR